MKPLNKHQIEQLQIKALSGQLTPDDSQRLMRNSILQRINKLTQEKHTHGQEPQLIKQGDEDD